MSQGPLKSYRVDLVFDLGGFQQRISGSRSNTNKSCGIRATLMRQNKLGTLGEYGSLGGYLQRTSMGTSELNK